MTIRRARPEDARVAAETLAAVAVEGVLGTEVPFDVDERAERFRAMIAADGPAGLWLLEDGDAVVGHVGVHTTHATGVLTFGMAILPHARGRGGGRALIQTVLEHARASGAHKVELEVWPDNARAIALYVAAGFEFEGVRRDHYRRRDGSLRSSVLMARRV